MLVKRLGPKDNRFDVFLGAGWDQHIRVTLEKGRITSYTPSGGLNVNPALIKGLRMYFEKRHG